MTIVSHLYRVTNKISGEYYIGKHNGREQNGYWGSGYRIQNSIKKYGVENFKYEILCLGPVDYIFELEKKYVTADMVDLDEKCLNLTIGGEGVNYHTKESKQKLREARAKQVLDYDKISKTMATLIWMNDGKKSYRIRPENVQEAKSRGCIEGRLHDYINEEYRETYRKKNIQQWQEHKALGHVGSLGNKVN